MWSHLHMSYAGIWCRGKWVRSEFPEAHSEPGEGRRVVGSRSEPVAAGLQPSPHRLPLSGPHSGLRRTPGSSRAAESESGECRKVGGSRSEPVEAGLEPFPHRVPLWGEGRHTSLIWVDPHSIVSEDGGPARDPLSSCAQHGTVAPTTSLILVRSL